jgi:hypothetical protein
MERVKKGYIARVGVPRTDTPPEFFNPKTIILIHTFEADKFPSIFKNVKLVKDGEVFVVT